MTTDIPTLFDLDPDNAGTQPPAPSEPLSYTRRLTRKRKTLLDQGIHPATRRPLLDPARGLTCASCTHLLDHSHNNNTYYKCGLAGITRGPATDIRKKWPACDRYKAKGDR